MKYLIMEDFAGQPVIFIFPLRVDHADMRDQLPYAKVIAAGYANLKDGEFHCHGGCAELQALARPEDAELLLQAFSDN